MLVELIISLVTCSVGLYVSRIGTRSHFISIWKFIYQNAADGSSYQINMPGIFSNTILTKKSKVKGYMG